jgi:hypothetical protein
MSDVTVFENGHENCISDKQRDKIKSVGQTTGHVRQTKDMKLKCWM